MLKRIAVLAGALVALAAAPATAEGYPPGDDLLTVSDASPCPGDTVTITAKTFAPGAAVDVSLDTTHLGSPTAGPDGVVTVEVTVPEGTPTGQHLFTAAGGDVRVTSTVDVVSCDSAPPSSVASSGGGGGLPTTGSDSTMTLVRIGLVLAALGGILLAVTTRRRRAARHAAA